jgi:uncharacterized protein
MEKSDFEWDDEKELQNIHKHGVSFIEAQGAFLDPLRVITEDLDHGADEKRYFCMGEVNDTVMPVRFTYRNNRIRIYGAGYWRNGKKTYEKKNKLHG